MAVITRLGTAEQVAAGLLAIVTVVVALAFFSETTGWIWRQFW